MKTSKIKKLLSYHKKQLKLNEENYNDKELYWAHSDAIEMYNEWLKSKTTKK